MENGPKRNLLNFGGGPDEGILMIFVKIAKWGIFNIRFSVKKADLSGICRR